MALDVDSSGYVYAATAYDSGNDNGPFRSYVSRIGRFQTSCAGRISFVPAGGFANVATQDGYKIESVTVVEAPGQAMQIFAGTDDENYGATMRPVWPID